MTMLILTHFSIRSSSTGNPNYEKGLRVKCRAPGKITSISGTYYLNLKVADTFEYKGRPKMGLIQSRISSNVGNTFKIICHGDHFVFDKELLGITSPVFQKMLNGNLHTKEARNNCVTIDDFRPNTIRSFKKFIFEDEDIDEDNDFTVELMMFCHKYNIEGLYELTREYFMDNIQEENLYELMKSAHFLDDEELLKKISEFIVRNQGDLGMITKDRRYISFKDSHPHCAVKILDLMMCGKQIDASEIESEDSVR